jgi:hypothetical protein
MPASFEHRTDLDQPTFWDWRPAGVGRKRAFVNVGLRKVSLCASQQAIAGFKFAAEVDIAMPGPRGKTRPKAETR